MLELRQCLQSQVIIGKSIAAVLAVLKAEVNQSHMTVLIRGEFSQNLRNVFRTPDAAVALEVARVFFHSHGTAWDLFDIHH